MWADELADHCATRPFALVASSHVAMSTFEITIKAAADDIAQILVG
jgi:hypothetical protein